MASNKLYYGILLIFLFSSLLFINCSNNVPTCGCVEANLDPTLNGTWSSIGESQYKTELKFTDSYFEWTWDDTLQQRGRYDTNDSIITVTITNNYGQKLLENYRHKYSIKGDTLTWVNQYVKK